MTKPTTKAPARKRVDWEAIERDYRTGQFSLRELEKKHGAGFSKIGKRAKDEAWSKDLADAVRQATSAALIAEVATERATEGLHGTTDVVLAVAEINKQVILGHRADIAEVRNLAADLLNELRMATQSPEQIHALFTLATDDLPGPAKVAITQQFNDFMRVHSRVGSVHKLADTLSKLQVMERKAFDIDTPEPGAPGSKGKPVASKTVYELTDDELVADIMARRSKAEQGADA